MNPDFNPPPNVNKDAHFLWFPLASVPDKATNDFLTFLTKDTKERAWLGGIKDNSENWSWSDGSPWTGYENWFDDQPSSDQDKDFLMFNLYGHGTWSNDADDATHAEGSLCQYDPEPCALDWSFAEHNNLCYKVVNIQTNGGQAVNTCKDAIANPSANLASIPDHMTNDFLARLTNRLTSWIGASKNSGDWAWSDGSGWNYTNWGSAGETGAGNHAVINWSGYFLGQWKSQTSNDYLAPALCQYDLKEETITTATPSPPATTTCPPPVTTTTTTCPATPTTTCSTIYNYTLCTAITQGVCSCTTPPSQGKGVAKEAL